jgi:hypothetical protein
MGTILERKCKKTIKKSQKIFWDLYETWIITSKTRICGINKNMKNIQRREVQGKKIISKWAYKNT